MPPSSSSLKGGGLYKIVVNESGYKIKKIYKGVIHGLIKFQNGYIISNSTYGLIFLNKNLKVTGKIKYKINTRIHGIAYSSKFKLFYLACSLQDKILIFNKKLKFINEIKISASLQNWLCTTPYKRYVSTKIAFTYQCFLILAITEKIFMTVQWSNMIYTVAQK